MIAESESAAVPAVSPSGKERQARIRLLRGRAAHIALPAVAVILTLIAYIATLEFEFVYDDRAQIIENRLLHSARFIPRYFTEHAWSYLHPGSLGNFYRPFTLLWK